LPIAVLQTDKRFLADTQNCPFRHTTAVSAGRQAMANSHHCQSFGMEVNLQADSSYVNKKFVTNGGFL